MFCPNCRSEYREGYTQCKNCHVALVDELSPIDENALEPKRELPWLKYLRIEYIPILCALIPLVFLILNFIQSVSSLIVSDSLILPHSRWWLLLRNLTSLPELFLLVLIILVFLYRLLGREFGKKRLFYQINFFAYLVLLLAFHAVDLVLYAVHYIQTFDAEWARVVYESDHFRATDVKPLIKSMVSLGLIMGNNLALVFFFLGRLRGWVKGRKVWIFIYIIFAVLGLVYWYSTHRFFVQSLWQFASLTAIVFLMFLDKDTLRNKMKHANS